MNEDSAVEPPSFPIVAIGASAGGLDALRRLFRHLPTDSGLAFVVIQHLDPERPSMLAHVLEGITGLVAAEAVHGVRVEPDRVHVIPPGADLTIHDGVVALIPRERTGARHLPVDTFFRSLAADRRGRAIGVILSGSGADGREGLRAIKGEGGIAIAQDPRSAQFSSMPESAIAAGVVDFTGSPEEIAAELVRLSQHPYFSAPLARRSEGEPPDDDDRNRLASVFALLRRHAGVDFAGYKRTTILRRIDRRMALRRLHSLAEYGRMLQDDPAEVRALAGDMLIHVTSFFREPDAFEALKEQVFRPLLERKDAADSVRIWVPGCSTGEEAYSVAMSLLDSMEESSSDRPVKIFGSDLSEQAVQAARQGVYSASAVADVAPGRLSRFFDRFDGGFRIAKPVRDLCVFARHDLTHDAPFARLDLISCRNVLIYFDADLQRRIIPTLHHCLNERGHLFLGRSETITSFPELFRAVDNEHRIFVKTGDSPRLAYALPVGREAEMTLAQKSGGLEPPGLARESQRQADYLLLSRYAPPAVIVNEQLEIVEYRGRTGEYLEPPPGQPQANILRMAREGLLPHLHEALERAKAQSTSVRKDDVRFQAGEHTAEVSIEVIPLASVRASPDRHFLVVFEEAAATRVPVSALPSAAAERPAGDAAGETRRLHAELLATRDYLQSVIAEHQATSGELAAANEELIAGNEELQSTNEELQSAKEELQSANEELTTVNDQLEGRNEELDRLANDLANILESVEIPVIIVDLELRVRRFTPTVREIVRFIPQDVGRPLEDLKLKIDVEDLSGRIRRVIAGPGPEECEVRGDEGRWFRMAIRPYRTADNRLDGAVLTFVDVNDLKRALDDAEAARDYARGIVETVTAALVVVNADAQVVSANDAFLKRFALSQKEATGKRLFDFGGGLWEGPVVRDALQALVGGGQGFAAIEAPANLPDAGRAVLFLSGRPIPWAGGERLFLLVIEDVTALRALEADRARLLESEKRARFEAERANQAKDLFLATLSHELRTPLSAMLMSAYVLKQTANEDERIQRASATIERSARSQARLIDDLLDVSRIVSGKLLLDMGPVDLSSAVHEAADAARASADAKGLDLSLDIPSGVGTVYGDGGRLQQVVSNLLVNAIKFTPRGGRVSVVLERVDRQALLTISDTGMGIRPDVVPHLFDRFVQADSSVTRTHGGLGLGLSIVRHLVEVHGGCVEVDSRGEGQGSTFRVTLPLGSAAPVRPAAAATVSPGIEGIRVLLVEDDEDTRLACATMLAGLGAVVRAEASARGAMAALDEFAPQVVLSDVAMPGEDGYTFIEKVRQRGADRGGQVPAAALTALAGDKDRRRALEAGFQMHIAKPVDPTRLTAVIRLLANSTDRPAPTHPAPTG